MQNSVKKIKKKKTINTSERNEKNYSRKKGSLVRWSEY